MIGDKLFKKMIVTYIVIILASFTVLGFLMTILLTNYFNYNKRSELIVKGADIAELIRPILLENKDPTDLVAWLNRADRNLGTEVWVIRPNGTVITASAHQWRHEGDRINEEEIRELQKGNVAIREGQSQFYSEPVIWVTTPIKNGNEVIGGVILYSPVIGITETLKKTWLLFIYAAFATLLFSVLVGFFFSKSVFAPLEEMDWIARKIANGDFSERLEIVSADEIGTLGRSINYMADKLEKLEKTRREFLANVSHDLRTPLTSILGFVEALQDNKDKNPETRARFLDILHSETSRLIRLVNDLLDFTKIEEGVLELNKQPVDIAELAGKTLAKYQPILKEKGIRTSFESSGNAIALVDSDRLEQVLTNLMDNAVRYARNRIALKVSQETQEIGITLSDDGPGIPGEDLPYIWDRFYKVDKSRAKGAGGTGLGLAIVKRLVDAHNGSIDVESQPGKGTTFIIKLPAGGKNLSGT